MILDHLQTLIELCEEILQDAIMDTTLTSKVKDAIKEAENAISEGRPENVDQIITLAIDTHHQDGEVEIDQNAIISEGDDNGCYVSAWVWVSYADTPFDKEKSEIPDALS